MIHPVFNLLAQTDTGSGLNLKYPAPTVHEGTYWFPRSASTFAPDIDWLYMAIFWVSLVFFAAIVGAMVYFVVKYRHRPGHKPEPSPSHNTALEIAWSVLPGFLLIWFFVDGTRGFFDLRIPPGNAEQIQVVAKQFDWTFYYPDGDSTPNVDGLHLVRGRPVEFVLESQDVLHSFFIPAFRTKQDVVPGRYSTMWAQPTETGTFHLYCTEYCGDSHSMMKTTVTVHETEAERKAATEYLWGDNSPLKNGERLFKMQCAGCHNTDDVRKTGPGLGGIWGKTETLDNGTTITVDDNYFRESLLNPNAKIVEGYARPSQMISFQGKLTDEQILWLRIYVKSLSSVEEDTAGTGTGTEAAAGAAAGAAPEAAASGGQSAGQPAAGDSAKDDSAKDDSAKDDSAKDDSAKDDSAKDDSAKGAADDDADGKTAAGAASPNLDQNTRVPATR